MIFFFGRRTTTHTAVSVRVPNVRQERILYPQKEITYESENDEIVGKV